MNTDELFIGRHLNSLRQEIEQKQARLAQKKAEFAEKRAQLHDLKLEITVVQSHVEMLQNLLIQANTSIFEGDEALLLDETLSSASREELRSPMEMLKPQFKGMQLGEIIQLVLDSANQPMTIAEIGRLIYETNGKEEFARARNSLSAELRSGAAKEPARWKKKGRSAYTSLSFQVGEEADRKLSQQSNAGGDAYAS